MQWACSGQIRGVTPAGFQPHSGAYTVYVMGLVPPYS